MSVTKIADITVKVGEYVIDGKTKGEYENVGALMRGDDDREFILINNSALNPSLAMIANKERRRRIVLNIFKDDGDTKGQRSAPAKTGKPNDEDPNDDIPF